MEAASRLATGEALRLLATSPPFLFKQSRHHSCTAAESAIRGQADVIMDPPLWRSRVVLVTAVNKMHHETSMHEA